MIKINKHIEIVRSSKANLSSMGGKSCELVRSVLARHYEKVGVTIVNSISDLDILLIKRPDLIFLGVKNLPMSNGASVKTSARMWVSDYLDKNNLNYTGSKSGAILLDFDKPTAKSTLQGAGLRTSPYFIAKENQYLNSIDLPLDFPLFIKPPNAGGGRGIGADSVVRDFRAYQLKVKDIADGFGTDALVEKYLTGREFSVALLETDSDNLLAMPIELITKQNKYGDRVLGKDIKAADTEKIINVADELERMILIKFAKKAFKCLGARDYGRIDIRMDENNRLYFLEANLIPGMADHDYISYFTAACRLDQNMGYEAMLLSIVRPGLARSFDIVPDPEVSTTEAVAIS